MTTPFEDLRDPAAQRPLMPLLVLFFVSGATGLLYEVIWMRRLTLVFGATQLAIATVLAAFMAGLALGATAGGRFADKRTDLLTIYGLLELVIGGYALAFPYLSDAATGMYRASVAAESVHFWSSQLVHLGMMGLLLLIPTAAMGATLPLLVRWSTVRLSRVGTRAGLLYGFNTAGAVVGTWVTGFVLLPAIGVRWTETSAAVANIAVGVIALAWGWLDKQRDQVIEVVDDMKEAGELDALLDIDPDPDLAPARRARVRVAVLAILAVSGGLTMIYEVAWSRFLALILGSSVYAFTGMLVAFLLGTAGGALAGAARMAVPGVRPMRWLAAALALAGITALATNHTFRFMPYWYVDLYAMLDGHEDLVLVGQWLLACVVMTPTTFCIGLTFPFAAAVVADRADAVGSDVSRLYALNTMGAVVGALAGGFILLPRLGIQETLLAAVVVDLALAGAVMAERASSRRTKLVWSGGLALVAAAALLVPPPWNPLLMSAGMYKYVSELSDFSHEAVRNYALSDFELLYYAEGTTSTVTVARSTGSGNIWLANNGKVDASSREDLRTQVLLAHLPFVARPDAKSALVVGLASGITAGGVTLHDDLERIDVLEIEPAIIVASEYFRGFNHQVLEDERVRVIPNDARNHLVLYDGVYDVIINEPSNPWISGVSNLFTKEFLELGRSRLSADGVFCQWLQIYGMGQDDLRSLIRTFVDVFPHVSVWYALDDSDVLLVGSRGRVDALGADLQELFAGRVGDDLSRIGIDHPYDLLTYQRMDRADLIEVAGDVGPNTDDNVRIEFSAPRYLHYSTAERNSELLEEHASGAWKLNRDAVPPDGELTLILGLARAFEKREHWYDAASLYVEALKLTPDDVRTAEAIARCYRKLEEAAAEP